MVMLYNSDDMVTMIITWLAMYIAAAATEMGDLPAAMSRSDACSENRWSIEMLQNIRTKMLMILLISKAEYTISYAFCILTFLAMQVAAFWTSRDTLSNPQNLKKIES